MVGVGIVLTAVTDVESGDAGMIDKRNNGFRMKNVHDEMLRCIVVRKLDRGF